MLGPMPLTASSSAWLALLTSVAAKAAAEARASTAAVMNLNMMKLLG